MIRKWMTTLLALMLAVMLPVCALADVQHTLTIEPGDELAAEPAIADLLKVLAFTWTQGEDSGELKLSLNEQDILKLAMKADANGLYARSNILSDDVMYVSWDDGFAVVTELIKSAMAEEDMLTDETAQALETGMAEIRTALDDALKAGVPAVAATTTITSPAEMSELAKTMFPDDSGMGDYLAKIYGRIEMKEGEFTAEGRDAATGHYTMTMTNEDLLALCDTNYMRTTIEQTLAASDPELQGEELTKQVDAALEEVRELYRQTDMDMVMDIYTADEGVTLVGMDATMNMTVPEDENTQSVMGMTMNYDRLTGETAVSHKADMNMVLNGEAMMDMLFSLDSGNDGTSKGSLAMLVEGAEITFLYDAASEGDVRTSNLSLYVRDGANAIVAPAASDRPIITLVLTTSPADEAALADVEAATAQTAVEVMKLSEAEMSELAAEVQTRAFTVLAALMGQLPTSTMQMVQSMQ